MSRIVLTNAIRKKRVAMGMNCGSMPSSELSRSRMAVTK